MPRRSVPLVNNEIYHIISRGVLSQKIFYSSKDYSRALGCLNFYKYHNPPIKYSQFLRLFPDSRKYVQEEIRLKNAPLVQILGYALMPNHIHLLVKQVKDDGIVTFMKRFGISYAKYSNLKNHKKGYVFESAFKSVRIRSEEQLIHVFRYIVLNPYSSGIISDLRRLETYPYTCLPEYFRRDRNAICDTGMFIERFGSIGGITKFIYDRAGYQRSLEKIKHLVQEPIG